ncbi:hypothetical protein BDV18DRAFT_161708 [Aspergillus unguis]
MALKRSFLDSPIAASTQSELASCFWGTATPELEHLRPYFQYYTEQCRIVFQSHKARLPLKTHEDIARIAEDILDNIPRSAVKERLLAKYDVQEASTEDVLDACIDLAVRLVFMLDVGEFPNAFSGRKKLVWGGGSIQDFLSDEIFTDSLPLDHSSVKLSGGFNVVNLVRIAGFHVELTTNLADHLRLRDTDKTVTIFHHASFLNHQRQSPFFPKGLIEETLSTLSLLFPAGNKACGKWYKRQDGHDELDYNVLECSSSPRRIDEYNYWHDRLVILKEAFDETRPSTLAQWWNDRREGTQWYTLWVAISLTLVFGLVQSVVGSLQLYKAYYP